MISRKGFIIIIALIVSSSVYAQEYDDLYFNKKDRKKVVSDNYNPESKQQSLKYQPSYSSKDYSQKFVNPESIDRYRSDEEVEEKAASGNDAYSSQDYYTGRNTADQPIINQYYGNSWNNGWGWNPWYRNPGWNYRLGWNSWTGWNVGFGYNTGWGWGGAGWCDPFWDPWCAGWYDPWGWNSWGAGWGWGSPMMAYNRGFYNGFVHGRYYDWNEGSVVSSRRVVTGPRQARGSSIGVENSSSRRSRAAVGTERSSSRTSSTDVVNENARKRDYSDTQKKYYERSRQSASDDASRSYNRSSRSSSDNRSTGNSSYQRSRSSSNNDFQRNYNHYNGSDNSNRSSSYSRSRSSGSSSSYSRGSRSSSSSGFSGGSRSSGSRSSGSSGSSRGGRR